MKIKKRILWSLIYLLSVSCVFSQDNMKFEVTSFSRGGSTIYEIDVDFDEEHIVFNDLTAKDKIIVKADKKELTELRNIIKDAKKMKSFEKNGALGGKGVKIHVDGKVIYFNEHVKDIKKISMFKALLKVLDAELKAQVLASNVFMGES